MSNASILNPSGVVTVTVPIFKIFLDSVIFGTVTVSIFAIALPGVEKFWKVVDGLKKET
jgi:hypothetical protein